MVDRTTRPQPSSIHSHTARQSINPKQYSWPAASPWARRRRLRPRRCRAWWETGSLPPSAPGAHKFMYMCVCLCLYIYFYLCTQQGKEKMAPALTHPAPTPTNPERHSVVSLLASGLNLGVLLAYWASPALIKATSWEDIFHVYGKYNIDVYYMCVAVCLTRAPLCDGHIHIFF